MLTPMKAIRAKCLDCCAGSQAEVRLCPRPKGKAVRYGWELPVLQQKILCVKRRC